MLPTIFATEQPVFPGADDRIPADVIVAPNAGRTDGPTDGPTMDVFVVEGRMEEDKEGEEREEEEEEAALLCFALLVKEDGNARF